MPLINIKMIDEGYSKEQIEELIKDLTDLMVNKFGKRRSNVMVLIEYVHPDLAGLNGLQVSKARQAATAEKPSPV